MAAQPDGRTLTIKLQGQHAIAFVGRLSEKRWAILQVLQSQGTGAVGVRELARRVGRDVKRVHEDVEVLTELGLVQRDDMGAVACPFSEVRIDMRLQGQHAVPV
ncbi:MAG: hypothetical protein EPO09_00070 [Aquabacterium sp.]|uniref:HVO_A0114 family putative DNA-binding protein n=1 Tax=Aquabacterium sp. TaxID=1872578 RepID=UPI0012085EED|nr:hypothetical protein [Aquabacterium sp.]TAL00148.1 MAG: hypothetical protein EPO09_00070 [Aquabacterium sp.]